MTNKTTTTKEQIINPQSILDAHLLLNTPQEYNKGLDYLFSVTIERTEFLSCICDVQYNLTDWMQYTLNALKENIINDKETGVSIKRGLETLCGVSLFFARILRAGQCANDLFDEQRRIEEIIKAELDD